MAEQPNVAEQPTPAEIFMEPTLTKDLEILINEADRVEITVQYEWGSTKYYKFRGIRLENTPRVLIRGKYVFWKKDDYDEKRKKKKLTLVTKDISNLAGMGQPTELVQLSLTADWYYVADVPDIHWNFREGAVAPSTTDDMYNGRFWYYTRTDFNNMAKKIFSRWEKFLEQPLKQRHFGSDDLKKYLGPDGQLDTMPTLPNDNNQP